MKWLVVVLAVLWGVWFWKRGRNRATARVRTPAKPIEMVACAVCGVHLPRSDALPGPQGHYCSTGHLGQAGR